MSYIAQACGETSSLAATRLVALIGERRPSACFFNFGASLPLHRLQLAGFHPSLRASWPKNEKGPPMNVPAFASQCQAHRYTLITRSECGCVASILHNAQESPEAATRVMIDAMRQGRRVECLPALVAAEDLHHSPAWGCARKRRVTLLRNSHLRARVLGYAEFAGAEEGNSTAFEHSHGARALLQHRSPSDRTPIVAPANKNPAVP